MEKVVLSESQQNISDVPPLSAFQSEVEKEDRQWEERYRRRRLFAQAESYLSSNAFILIFLFIYVNSQFLMYVWGARDEYVHQNGHPKRFMITIARGFGYTLNLNCALVILLAARLAFTLLRETALNLILPFDKTFPAFHIIVGYCIAVAVAGHGFFHMIWIIVWNGWGPGIWGVTWCVITGFFLASVLSTMVLTAGQTFRTKRFPVFYAIHNVGALVFFVTLCLHGMYNGEPYTYKWVVGPVALYLIDRTIRRLATSQVAIELSMTNSVLKGPEVLKISMPKSFNYKAGQYAEIKVPSISKHEWHPFTIASAPHEAEMTFFVKAVGDWTKALYSAFEDRVDKKVASRLKILVRGPFGAPAQHVGGYERIVLISGGVGSTPFSSICRELHHYLNQQQDRMDRHFDLSSSDDNSGPAAEQIEDKLNLVVNRTFSVQYGEPIVPTRDEATRGHLREELLHISDVLSPRPMNRSPFQRPNYAELLNYQQTPTRPSTLDRVRRTPRFSRKNSIIPSKKQHSREEPAKKENMTKMIGMSFNMGHASGSLIKDKPNDVEDDGKLIEEEFAMKTMHLDDKNVAISLGQNLAAMSSRTQRALSVLHSISLNMAMFLILLTRLAIVGYAHIFRAFRFSMSMTDLSFSGARWLIVADLAMGLIVTVIIAVTIALEFKLHGGHFFQSKGHLADTFLLMPFSLAAVIVEIVILNREPGRVQSSLLAALLLMVILPVNATLLGVRLQRIVGSRVMLADTTGDVAYTRMRAVDFIWTTPHAADDSWLLERLIPIADKTKLRLHRYITRESVEDGSDGAKHDDKALQTNFGRPDWDAIFRAIAQRSPSTSKVGVFFCGPKGMSKAVQTALIKAQTLSNLRGTYLGHGSDIEIKSELGAVNVDLNKLRRRGSYIRFMFREENFG